MAFNTHMDLKLIAGVISLWSFCRNEISFQVIKYHVNTTQNEMPMHVYMSIKIFCHFEIQPK